MFPPLYKAFRIPSSKNVSTYLQIFRTKSHLTLPTTNVALLIIRMQHSKQGTRLAETESFKTNMAVFKVQKEFQFESGGLVRENSDEQ